MNPQQIPTRDPARIRALPPRLRARETPRPRAVGAVDHLVALIEATGGGPVERSLLELASASACDAETARRAVASLDPADHALSVDIHQVPAEEPWILAWAPVTAIVDLMLDWDLLTLDISVAELSEWLEASPALTSRAVEWLALTPGVTVLRGGNGHEATVRINIALDRCPLTAEARSAAG
jgi:hypothetical protein